MKKYLFAYAVLATALLFFTCRHYRAENRRLVENQTALAADVTRYRTRLGAEAASEIARRSRGTPRIANRLLRRVRDYAEVRADGVITRDIAKAALEVYDVDELGLDRLDRAVLSALTRSFGGGPVGVSTFASEWPSSVCTARSANSANRSSI